MKLFLDTNVWLDLLLVRKPSYHYAAKLALLAEEQKVVLDISSLSIVTSQYVCCVTSRMPLTLWKEKLNGFLEVLDIQPVTKRDILFALRSRWKDFEDAVQYSCAARAGSDIIVTRNPRDFALSEIPVLSPQEALRRLYPH